MQQLQESETRTFWNRKKIAAAAAAFYRTNNRILRVHTHISDVIRSTDYVRDMGQLEIHGAELGGLDCTTMQIARINE